MPTPVPQAVLAPLTESAIFLTFRLTDDTPAAADQVRGLLADLGGLRRSVGFRIPEGDERRDAVLIGGEDPSYVGGSYVITQKYVHDLAAWGELTVEQQELAIGRTKTNDIELPDDRKPSNSHVALTTVVDEHGVERDIVRDNMPFGRVGAGEYGTYFIGYSRDPGITEQMLQNMFVGRPAGNHDRVLDFSTAVTGTLFFVPTADFLDGAADG